jgi:hypothetical protein
MQAIITKYIPPSAKGSRIKATCERGTLTIPFDHECDTGGAHRKAAQALINVFINEDKARNRPDSFYENPWSKPFASGALPDGLTYAHVFI